MGKHDGAEDRDTLAVAPADPDEKLPQGGTFNLPTEPPAGSGTGEKARPAERAEKPGA